jgi:polyhydroxyalkanoate synthesis regulator phasin
MRAWQRRGEGEWEWEGMERRRREESVARGELEREERKKRVADYERRHQERIRQVPDWQRRSWEKMERWLEESRGEEGQEEVRQMREEVKELRVVRRVLELELAEAEAAGRCVESVSEGVQCGWGSVGWVRKTRGRGARSCFLYCLSKFRQRNFLPHLILIFIIPHLIPLNSTQTLRHLLSHLCGKADGEFELRASCRSRERTC